MAVETKELGQVVLDTSDGVILTGAPGVQTILTGVHITNTGSAQKTVKIHRRAATATADETNAILFDTPVKGNGVVVLDKIILDAGSVLSGSASAVSSITVTASGVEVS